MKRRDFSMLTRVGAANASLLTACGHPEEKLTPAFIHGGEGVPAVAVNIAGIRTVSPESAAMSILKLGRCSRLAKQLPLKDEGGYGY
jgi:hypothetical protein